MIGNNRKNGNSIDGLMHETMNETMNGIVQSDSSSIQTCSTISNVSKTPVPLFNSSQISSQISSQMDKIDVKKQTLTTIGENGNNSNSNNDNSKRKAINGNSNKSTSISISIPISVLSSNTNTNVNTKTKTSKKEEKNPKRKLIKLPRLSAKTSGNITLPKIKLTLKSKPRISNNT